MTTALTLARVALETILPTPVMHPDGELGSGLIDVSQIVNYVMKRVPTKAKRDEIEQHVIMHCYYNIDQVLKEGMNTGIIKCAGASPSSGDSTFFNGHDKFYTNFVKLARDPSLDFFDISGTDTHYRFFASKSVNIGRKLWSMTKIQNDFMSFLDNAIVTYTRRYS
jgi:hypothetical protein